MSKIAVLVSGGVDSSVALSLLSEQGEHELKAYYLKIWLEEDLQFLGECPWQEDLRYAHAVCERLGVELEVVSLQSAYWDRVVAHTIDELKKGHTPSPDILCNQKVKFGAFIELLEKDYDYIASGHYARVEHLEGEDSRLFKGVDPIKDQTYFLSRLSKEQLSRCLFPIGGYQKAEVRDLAARFKLENQHRKDSQGICFLGKIKYNDFVSAQLGEKAGKIVDISTNEVVGSHKGYWFHTIGQRKGLGLSGGPWYVVSKDVKRNLVYVAHAESRYEVSSLSFHVRECHWFVDPSCHKNLSVKIRHGARVISCKVYPCDEMHSEVRVELDEKDGGIADGQYAVFYAGDLCLGSGIISNS